MKPSTPIDLEHFYMKFIAEATKAYISFSGTWMISDLMVKIADNEIDVFYAKYILRGDDTSPPLKRMKEK
jgi:hypothetical protein